jgi:predicted  nucleic acid-binding Zn-ribbon protein
MSLYSEEMMDPRQPALVVTYGHTPRKVRPLQRDLVVIGQGRGSDIGVVGPDIADAHCVVFRTAEGWRLRDCGSRAGTRLNGKAVGESVLCDGDVLQVGTFNFRVYLPDNAPGAVVGSRERQLQRSRRRLVQLALGLRRRLRRERAAAGTGISQADLDQHIGFLRERLRQYEARVQQLQQAERELTTDRARLEEEGIALRVRGEQTERALVQRRSAVEAELRRRREECEERCRELERLAAAPRAPAAPPTAGAPEEAHRLDLRRRELDCYAHHLRRLRQRSGPAGGSVDAELEELRAENLQLRHLLAQRGPNPEATAREAAALEQLRAELAAARREAAEKETQVQRLLTERQSVDDSAEGMDVESYEAELAEFRRQLQEDRRGVNEEIRRLRERTVDLDEAARAMEQQLALECERLAAEGAELDRLRTEVYQQLGQAPPGGRDGLTLVGRFKETMAALTRSQEGPPRPAGGETGGSSGRGARLRAPRRGDGSGSAGR